MIKLPNDCLVKKFISKDTFYNRLGVTSTVKDEFVNLVKRITWMYKLSESTINVAKTDNVEEIQIFEIELKEKKIPKNVIKTISKGIPYQILFVIKCDDNYCYAIRVNDTIYYTDWNENIDFDFSGLNLEKIYENIVKLIIKEENNNEDFSKIVDIKNKTDELNKKIDNLKNKVKNEKQFNKKVELNNQLKKLLNEMEEINNE